MISSSDSAAGSMAVLVVDDSRSSLDVLSSLVRSMPDCAAHPFLSSARALEWCQRHDPDLVLVDYQMPPPDGLAFIHAFRREIRCAEVPIIMVTSDNDRDLRHAALTLGATDFLTKPFDEIEFLARARNLLKLRRNHLALCNRSQWLADEVRKATRAMAEREREAILFLSRAAEHRDPETGDHLVRMGTYSRLIAEALGLSANEVDLIHTAAPMHDIGKIGIPDHILLKPGKLSSEEMSIMQQHAVIGYEILADSTSPLLRMAAEIAYSHHERFDGAGYPRGLHGDCIPLVGRITALADAFDALASARPYKPAWPLDQARDHVVQSRGRHFDPICVEAFLSCWPDVLKVAASLPATSHQGGRSPATFRSADNSHGTEAGLADHA